MDLSIQKCRRALRPLLTKINNMCDFEEKFPMEINYDFMDLETKAFSKSELFCNPRDSAERLLHLKTLMSPRIFQAYREIFSIFRGTVMLVDPPKENHILLLKQTAALRLGKVAALNTKSSFYKLSQTALFDRDTLPEHLRRFTEELADNMDEFFNLDPVMATDQYNGDFFLGYIFELVILYLGSFLQDLIPVLVHWLHEEGYVGLSRALFWQFWLRSLLLTEYEALVVLQPHEDLNALMVFWEFQKVGYYDALARKIGATPTGGSLLLEMLATTNRFDLSFIDRNKLFTEMSTHYQSPFNNSILMQVLTSYMTRLSGWSKRSNSQKALGELNQSYTFLKEIVQLWLPLRNECVFDSLARGNNEIFAALRRIILCQSFRTAQVLGYLKQLPSTSRTEELHAKFQALSSRFCDLEQSLVILKAFYLDEPLEKFDASLVHHRFAKYLAELVALPCLERELDAFLDWLHDFSPRLAALLDDELREIF